MQEVLIFENLWCKSKMFDIATYNPHKSLWTMIFISIINFVRSECLVLAVLVWSVWKLQPGSLRLTSLLSINLRCTTLACTLACTGLCPHCWLLLTGICYSGVSAQWFPSYLHVQFERWKWKYYDTLEYTLSNRWISFMANIMFFSAVKPHEYLAL